MTMRGGGCLTFRLVRRGAALGVASVGVVVMGGPVGTDGGGWCGLQTGTRQLKISASATGKQRSVIRRSGLMLALT